jgi:hypothetical protein
VSSKRDLQDPGLRLPFSLFFPPVSSMGISSKSRQGQAFIHLKGLLLLAVIKGDLIDIQVISSPSSPIPYPVRDPEIPHLPSHVLII